MRRIILIGTALLTLLGLASPAMASPRGNTLEPVNRLGVATDFSFKAYIQEADGTLCVDTGGINQGNYAYNGNCAGRVFNFVQVSGGYFDPDGRCVAEGGGVACHIFLIEAGKDSSTGVLECLASTDSTRFVLLKPCAGSTGVNWSLLCTNPHATPGCTEWILFNDYASNTNGTDYMLAGDTGHGDRVVPNCWQCTSGQFEQWNLNP
jgi:hypothetical protein